MKISILKERIMLKALNTKVSPILALAATLVSCGKKVQEKDNTVVTNQGQTAEASVTITVNGSVSSTAFYNIPKNANTALPTSLIVKSGNLGTKKVNVYYNVRPSDATIYEFKCVYVPASPNTTLKLSDCAGDHGSFGNIAGQVFPMDQGMQIKYEIVGKNNSGLVIFGDYNFIWK